MAVVPEHTEKQWLQEGDGGAVVFFTIRLIIRLTIKAVFENGLNDL